jgi:predicted DNA-binding transcriptional regulator AlpA
VVNEQIRPSVELATATIPEFARRYGIARSTAYALAKCNSLPIPVIRLGRRLVVSRSLMEAVLAGETVGATQARRSNPA